MKEKVIERTMMGIIIAHFINFIIAAAVNIFIVRDGHFHFLRPGMAEGFGGEIPAMILQSVILTIFGGIFGASSLIYERDDWGLTKQTAVHFPVLVGSYLIVGGLLHWYQFNAVNVIAYFLFFSVLYFLIWVGWYMKIKKDIERVNQKISE